jgi:hypothetical protein
MKYKYKILKEFLDKDMYFDIKCKLAENIYCKRSKTSEKIINKIYKETKENTNNLKDLILHELLAESDYYDNWGLCERALLKKRYLKTKLLEVLQNERYK